MCFSSAASFVTSDGLAILGGLTLIQAKKSDRIFAFIPLIFCSATFFRGVVVTALEYR